MVHRPLHVAVYIAFEIVALKREFDDLGSNDDWLMGEDDDNEILDAYFVQVNQE